MHLFHDSTLNTWRLITEKLPERCSIYCENGEISKCHDSECYSYDKAIAALKQNALTVGNPEIFVIDRNGTPYAKTHTIMPWASCPMRVTPDELYFWPGGYETKETDKVIDFEGSECYPIYETVAILTLPEEKNNTMENMTETQRYRILSRTSFKNVSGNWQFTGDMTPERFIEIFLNVLGSVAAPKEEDNDTPEKKWLKIRSTQEILDNRYAKIKQLESELAAAKESIKELIELPHVYAKEHQHIRDTVSRAKALLDKQ